MEANEYRKMFEFENDYWWYRGLHELVRHYVGRGPGGLQRRILDAGCGTGRTLEQLAGLGQTEGIDYSQQAVELCRRRGIKRAVVADLNTWRGEAEAYDMVISLDVLCTEGIDDDAAVFSELYRVLRPGGELILNLPAFRLLRRRHDLAVSGLRRYRRSQTIRQLRTQGFEIKRAGYRLPLLFLIILIRKLFESRTKSPIVSDLSPLPNWLNALLLTGHRFDNLLFTWHIHWPIGSSLFIVCRKRRRQDDNRGSC